MDEGEEESDGRGEGEKNGFKKKGGEKDGQKHWPLSPPRGRAAKLTHITE